MNYKPGVAARLYVYALQELVTTDVLLVTTDGRLDGVRLHRSKDQDEVVLDMMDVRGNGLVPNMITKDERPVMKEHRERQKRTLQVIVEQEGDGSIGRVCR